MSDERVDPIVRGLADLLARSIDATTLRRELRGLLDDSAPSQKPPPPVHAGGAEPGDEKHDGASEGTRELLAKIVLEDILDDSILSARAGDKIFPLRLFFGQLGQSMGKSDTAFSLAAGLNFFFRAVMDEESKMRLGIEASRLYYRFAKEAAFEAPLVAQVSPLLAALMSTELGKLRFEATDHVAVFDSQIFERDRTSDPASSTVQARLSFLCRVSSNNMVRAKATVRT